MLWRTRGKLRAGDQPAALCGNISSSWLRTRSQFRQRACQCFMILCEAKYSIRRRESSLVKDGLFFAIYRNWRFKPSMMFVVYMIFRFSSGYSKKVLKTPQFGGIEYLASQRIMTHWHAGCQNWDLVLSQLELMFPQRVAG